MKNEGFANGRSVQISFRAAAIAIFVLFTVPRSSHALPPIKNHLCFAMFRQIALTRPEILAPDNAYVLNSFRAFREHVLKDDGAQAAIPEGFMRSDGPGWGLNRKSAAARVAGIEAFAKTTEGADVSQRQFTQTISLSGKENIETFLSELQQNVKLIDADYRTKYLSRVLIANMWGMTIQAPIFSSSQLGVKEMAALLFMHFYSGQDYLVRRPLYWDAQFLKQLESASRSISHDDHGWALISRNFKIHPDDVKTVRQTVAEDVVIPLASSHSYSDGAPLIKRLAEAKEDRERSWVGLDMLFERNAAGEPELHIVMRGSEDRPIFPKKSPDKSKIDSEISPATVPGLVPIPIRPGDR